MAITFNCSGCGKEVRAPDDDAGKRGKCPFCGHASYIPTPVGDNDVLPLVPLDEEEERRRQQEIRKLMEKEHALLRETGKETPVASPEGQDPTPNDLQQFVINYCLDLANSKLDRLEVHVAQLRRHRHNALETVDAALKAKVVEPALKDIPPRVRKGFLLQLRDSLK